MAVLNGKKIRPERVTHLIWLGVNKISGELFCEGAPKLHQDTLN
jgi:hypothetical protein